MSLTSLYRASVAALVFLPSLPSARAQLRQLDNYAQVTQYGNDDDSTDAVAFGFSADLFGTTY
jgi:hypothetical protein